MNEKAIVKKQNGVEKEDIAKIAAEYLKVVGQNVKPEDAVKFINICKFFNLNPFKREIYFIPFGNAANIIVGYEVYLKRAERSGKLAGWKVWTEGSLEKGDLKACVEIKRKDWDQPFYHEVYFEEYNQNNAIWKTKPRTMIKKVAIAQAFRLCFPEEIGGLPYIEEELPIEAEVVEEKQEPKQIEHKKEFTLSEINKIASKELKEVVRKYPISSKELIELFNKHEGNQEKIIQEIVEKKGGEQK